MASPSILPAASVCLFTSLQLKGGGRHHASTGNGKSTDRRRFGSAHNADVRVFNFIQNVTDHGTAFCMFTIIDGCALKCLMIHV